jgi:hypothetical protein
VNAFTYPTVGTFSNVRRNSFYGPGYLLTDMMLQRYFPLTAYHEGMRLLFRAEAFNVWNTPNLAKPKAQFSCTTTSIQQPGNANYGLPCTTQRRTTVGSLNLTSASHPVDLRQQRQYLDQRPQDAVRMTVYF